MFKVLSAVDSFIGKLLNYLCVSLFISLLVLLAVNVYLRHIKTIRSFFHSFDNYFLLLFIAIAFFGFIMLKIKRNPLVNKINDYLKLKQFQLMSDLLTRLYNKLKDSVIIQITIHFLKKVLCFLSKLNKYLIIKEIGDFFKKAFKLLKNSIYIIFLYIYANIYSICKFLFIILIILLLGNLYVQYIPEFNFTFNWFDETVEWIFAWIIFFGTAALWRQRDHFKIEWLYDQLKNKRAGHIVFFMLEFLSLLFMLVLTYQGYDYTMRTTAWTAYFNISRKYLYVCIPISGSLMVIYSIKNMITELIAFIQFSKKGIT